MVGINKALGATADDTSSITAGGACVPGVTGKIAFSAVVRACTQIETFVGQTIAIVVFTITLLDTVVGKFAGPFTTIPFVVIGIGIAIETSCDGALPIDAIGLGIG